MGILPNKQWLIRIMGWVRSVFRRESQTAPFAPLRAISYVIEWGQSDAKNWDAFLQSETGRRFQLRLRAVESKHAIDACKESISTTHAAGCAAGFSQCIEMMLAWRSAFEVPVSQEPQSVEEVEAAQESAMLRELGVNV